VPNLEASKTFFIKRAPRHSVNLNAWIRQTGSFAIQECRVIEVSRTGAKLEIENTQNISDNFLLLFAKSDTGNRATVVWRRGTEVGVEFVSANPPQPPA
jgi:PilZ domain